MRDGELNWDVDSDLNMEQARLSRIDDQLDVAKMLISLGNHGNAHGMSNTPGFSPTPLQNSPGHSLGRYRSSSTSFAPISPHALQTAHNLNLVSPRRWSTSNPKTDLIAPVGTKYPTGVHPSFQSHLSFTNQQDSEFSSRQQQQHNKLEISNPGLEGVDGSSGYRHHSQGTSQYTGGERKSSQGASDQRGSGPHPESETPGINLTYYKRETSPGHKAAGRLAGLTK